MGPTKPRLISIQMHAATSNLFSFRGRVAAVNNLKAELQSLVNKPKHNSILHFKKVVILKDSSGKMFISNGERIPLPEKTTLKPGIYSLQLSVVDFPDDQSRIIAHLIKKGATAKNFKFFANFKLAAKSTEGDELSFLPINEWAKANDKELHNELATWLNGKFTDNYTRTVRMISNANSSVYFCSPREHEALFLRGTGTTPREVVVSLMSSIKNRLKTKTATVYESDGITQIGFVDFVYSRSKWVSHDIPKIQTKGKERKEDLRSQSTKKHKNRLSVPVRKVLMGEEFSQEVKTSASRKGEITFMIDSESIVLTGLEYDNYTLKITSEGDRVALIRAIPEDKEAIAQEYRL